jgi:hypothetical protein
VWARVRDACARVMGESDPLYGDKGIGIDTLVACGRARALRRAFSLSCVRVRVSLASSAAAERVVDGARRRSCDRCEGCFLSVVCVRACARARAVLDDCVAWRVD